jgi:hypothetical protein
MGAAIIAGVDAALVLESAEYVFDLVPAAVERGVVRDGRAATQLEVQPYSVVRRSPDATLEDFKDVPPSHQLAKDNRAPPEASICCPVTHRKSSDSTAAITAPTSFASPRRPSAVIPAICWAISGYFS